MTNMEGDDKIRSLPGALLSIVTRVLGLAFALQVATRMIKKEGIDVGFYTTFESSSQLMNQVVNMPDAKLDIAVGFNKNTDPF